MTSDCLIGGTTWVGKKQDQLAFKQAPSSGEILNKYSYIPVDPSSSPLAESKSFAPIFLNPECPPPRWRPILGSFQDLKKLLSPLCLCANPSPGWVGGSVFNLRLGSSSDAEETGDSSLVWRLFKTTVLSKLILLGMAPVLLMDRVGFFGWVLFVSFVDEASGDKAVAEAEAELRGW